MGSTPPPYVNTSQLFLTMKVVSWSNFILDSSYLGRSIAGNLLIVTVDLPLEVTLPTPGVSQIILKTTPFNSSDTEAVEFLLDIVYENPSQFYIIIPFSRIPFRQFYVQIALFVEGGPILFFQLKYLRHSLLVRYVYKVLL